MTPQESHYRDILTTVLVRLRNLPRDNHSSAEMQREVARIADMIAARIDQQPKGEAE